jgi:hypothetical protein
MVAVAFRVEMHQNDVFFIFKKVFLRSAHQNDPKHKKKKNWGMRCGSQTEST